MNTETKSAVRTDNENHRMDDYINISELSLNDKFEIFFDCGQVN